MPEREKVIRGLECCSQQRGGPELCEQCPYCIEPFPCSNVLLHDALALLKAQEPKLVVQTTSTIRCPGCGKQITSKGAIHKEIKYCWKCGQAVKWDE